MSESSVVAVRFKDEKFGYAVIEAAQFDPELHEQVECIPTFWDPNQTEGPAKPAEPETPPPSDTTPLEAAVVAPGESPEEKAKREAEESAVAVRRMTLEAMTRRELAELIVTMGVKEVKEKTAKHELVDGILDLEAFRRQEAEMRAAQ